ncbi:MAG TPA: hypothetical protein DEF85_00580 [Clostridiaceae bacterium]|jgi:competence protein ComEA|nr:hypothetical protein [Clostridiaceae bacterium]HBF76949.1 hypothetical protein [Clostridiaceae bacterium]HBG38253.1 hypothetical protein [Clostridiaceae bacterium]HBN29047.1 hypothetical protein [Clostridiaceae bacterium]HBX47385.1 hypothetical protein [Clostridiaceae bacterium]
MDLSKREKIGIIIFSLIIVSVISIDYYSKAKDKGIQVIKNEDMTQEAVEKKIQVYICGEVKKPGVYELHEGDRLIKLISLAGGITEKGDENSINMSVKLKDEDYIRIPAKNENASTNQIQSSTGYDFSGKININTASLEELKTLPRIGDALANRILEYRAKNGPFKDIKDIKNVSGIGEKMFENIKDKICVY